MICGHWVQKIWIFVRFLEAVMSKQHIKFPSEVFGEKIFFWKNNAFLSIKFRTLSKKSEFLSEKFRRVFQTYDQYAIRNILKTNLWEKHCIKDLRTLKQDFLNVCRNFCSCLVKTALLVSVGSFWGLRFFFQKKQCLFWKKLRTFSKTIWASCWILFGGCQNYNLCVQKNNLMKNCHVWSFLHSQIRSKNFLLFCQKFFGRVFKTAFYVSSGTFWGDPFFLWKTNFLFQSCSWSGKLPSLLSIEISGIVQTAIYVSIGTFWWKSFFRKKNFSIFGHWTKNSGFSSKFFDGYVKTVFYVYKITFWAKILSFEEKICNIFGEWNKKLSAVCRLFCQKSHLLVQKDNLRKISLLRKLFFPSFLDTEQKNVGFLSLSKMHPRVQRNILMKIFRTINLIHDLRTLSSEYLNSC